MNTIDVMVRARAAVMGESEEVLHAAILGSYKNRPEALASLQRPLEDAKAETLLLHLRVHLEKFKAYAAEHPDEIPEMLKEMGVDEDEMHRHQAIYASHELAARAEKNGGNHPLRVSRESLAKIGSDWWPASWAHAESDDDFQSAGKAMVEYANATKNENMQLALQTEILQTQWLLFSRWAHFGFPVVQLGGHKYAAALMATSFSAETEVHPPWKTFLIEVPEGLLHTASALGNGEKESVVYLLVNEHPAMRPGERLPTLGENLDVTSMRRVWSLLGFTAQGTTLHRMRMTVAEHLGPVTEDGFASGEAFGVALDSEDDRVLLLLSRLALNTCLAMSDTENVRKLGKHPGEIKRGEKLPTCRVFRVGKPVEIDCRPALRDYIEGKRRNPLAVQFLVRGHWRNQACGLGMKERKWKWIEPYWKGPEDAPINMREHKLGEKK